ncbi:MAG: hypothetical protein IPM96_08345 [Ignavibacteria bacterium]|nr:hypothetical protein [Ignavibacteria bacterium]
MNVKLYGVNVKLFSENGKKFSKVKNISQKNGTEIEIDFKKLKFQVTAGRIRDIFYLIVTDWGSQ